jgi:hypothetical protein
MADDDILSRGAFGQVPADGDPFATSMIQPMAQPGEMPHAIMPEQERELGGGGTYEPIPLLGGGSPAPRPGATEPAPGDPYAPAAEAAPARKAEQAAPITAYHAAEQPFASFDPTRMGTNDPGHLGQGFYFSTDPAIGRSSPTTLAADLNVQNPLKVSLPDFKTDKQVIVRDALRLSGDASAQDVTSALVAKGHDGVMLDYSPTGYTHQEIMVPDAGQIQNVREMPSSSVTPPEPANDWRFGGGSPPIGHNQPPPDPAPGEADRISTRVPTAAKLDFNPHETSDLQVGLASSKAAAQAYEKNADIIRNYRATGLQDPVNLTADQVSEGFIEHLKNNLLALHDYMPEDMRNAAKGWYEGANTIANTWATQYGLEPRQVAGVIAAQSPQKDWNQNVSLAKRVLDISRDQGDTTITDGMNRWATDYMANPKTSAEGAALMQDFLDRNQGVPLNQMTKPNDRAHFIRIFDEAHNDRNYPLLAPDGSETGPALNADGTPSNVGWGSMRDIAKATSVLQNGSVPNISQQMGEAHKVRNFYNNIISPLARQGDVTIDTHAIAAANLYPLTGDDAMTAEGLGQKGSANNLTGSKGLYGLYAEAYRRAAQARNLQPRQLQSVVWEGARSLFPADKKALMSYRANIEQVWQGYHDGLLTLPQAQQKLFEAAGGIRPPDWAGGTQGAAGQERNPAGYAAPGYPVDQGQLPERDLHGAAAAPAGGGGGGAAPGTVPAQEVARPGSAVPASGDPFAIEEGTI